MVMKKALIAAAALVLASAASAADKENGKALVEKNNCAACHGADLKKPISPEYPKLAGQHDDYLYHALVSYQTTNNALVGRSNAIMAGQVAKFSHKDLQDIAAYIASLPGELIVKR